MSGKQNTVEFRLLSFDFHENIVGLKVDDIATVSESDICDLIILNLNKTCFVGNVLHPVKDVRVYEVILMGIVRVWSARDLLQSEQYFTVE